MPSSHPNGPTLADDVPDAAAPDDAPPATTDGRQLRRERNRNTVVEALLDLYRDGNLKPSSEEIAERSGLSPRSLFRYFDDVDDLVRSAISSQLERAIPLVAIDAPSDAPVEDKVSALVEMRFRLFEAVGNAAAVMRLRAPYQPVLASALTRNRGLFRWQMRTLFAPELEAMGDAGERALAAADVMASFEARQLLLEDQGLTVDRAKLVMVETLLSILRPTH